MDKNRKKLYEEYFDNEEMKSIMIAQIDQTFLYFGQISCIEEERKT